MLKMAPRSKVRQYQGSSGGLGELAGSGGDWESMRGVGAGRIHGSDYGDGKGKQSTGRIEGLAGSAGTIWRQAGSLMGWWSPQMFNGIREAQRVPREA